MTIGDIYAKLAVAVSALQDIVDLVEQLPGGIDEETDPADPSPDDMVAHIGGLIYQKCQETLGAMKEVTHD